MIHVYLCDDNQIVLKTYDSLLHKIAENYSFEIHTTTFHSGEQLLFFYEDSKQDPDIIFLDILMEGIDGLSTAKKLRQQNCQSELIFLTANSEYVFDSFDVSPSNYIVKNSISPKRFEQIFLKAISMAAQRSKTFFPCENGAVQKNIPLSAIEYFEVKNRIITVHYDKTCFHFYSTLDDVALKLSSPGFLRIHRSFLVNLTKINQVGTKSLTLSNNQELPIGITYSRKVKESINRYFSIFN